MPYLDLPLKLIDLATKFFEMVQQAISTLNTPGNSLLASSIKSGTRAAMLLVPGG